MKMTDAEIREQMKTQVWVRAESKDDYKKILIYLEENGIEGLGHNLNPDNVPEPSSEPGRRYPYWPIAIDYANKKASSAFLTMAKKSPEEVASLRANLLKYCGLDTFAMVKVLQKLREVAI